MPRVNLLASIARGVYLIAIAVATTRSLMLAPTNATAQVEVEQMTATLAAGDSEGRASAFAQQAAELYLANNAQAKPATLVMTLAKDGRRVSTRVYPSAKDRRTMT